MSVKTLKSDSKQNIFNKKDEHGGKWGLFLHNKTIVIVQ